VIEPSENAEFGWLCRYYGTTFIGPSPQAIYLMGRNIHLTVLVENPRSIPLDRDEGEERWQ
jgi:acetyl/propionyl-CoA carboxylase alpha subunit|tara:strand:- start:76 stop:258 length:183 start_codon:yes stop_codon:yes gene_type:complete